MVVLDWNLDALKNTQTSGAGTMDTPCKKGIMSIGGNDVERI